METLTVIVWCGHLCCIGSQLLGFCTHPSISGMPEIVKNIFSEVVLLLAFCCSKGIELV
jgi:hypothetical protein